MVDFVSVEDPDWNESIEYVGQSSADAEPAGYRRRALKLWRPMERLNPNRRPRGFAFTAPTRALYDQSRRSQLIGDFSSTRL